MSYRPQTSARETEYNVLLVGETGAGKSTLINMMGNYFLNGSLRNIEVVIPTKYLNITESGHSSEHSESALDDETKSKTTKCLTYTFTHPKNRSFKFVFIDSPGLSDTGGTKQDDKNIDEIINAAVNVDFLSAIVVIANGTQPRLTTSFANTLVRLGNILPDDLIDNNLLLVLTKCSVNGASFSVEEFAKKISKPKKVFYIDNQAFCSDPSKWQMDENAFEVLNLNWKQSLRIIDNLLIIITGMSNKSTDSFKIMIDLRNKLKSEIATICDDIGNFQKVLDYFGDIQIESAISGFKKGHLGFHSCLWEIKSHIHDRNGTNRNMNKDISCKLKKMFEEVIVENERISELKANCESTLNLIQSVMDQKYLKINQLCNDINKICSRFNIEDEIKVNIQNMELEAQMITNVDLRNEAEIEIAKLVKLADDLFLKLD